MVGGWWGVGVGVGVSSRSALLPWVARPLLRPRSCCLHATAGGARWIGFPDKRAPPPLLAAGGRLTINGLMT